MQCPYECGVLADRVYKVAERSVIGCHPFGGIMGGVMNRLMLCALTLTLLMAGCAPATVPPTPRLPPPMPSETPIPEASPTDEAAIEYQPSGSVEIDGRGMTYRCEGEGTPTVIIETAYGVAGASDSQWDAILAEIAETTRICVYDRAGLGQSDPVDMPRTSEAIATDLHNMLIQAGIELPYVLVAHSLGGFHARVYAEMYPQDVVGLLLVDSFHPDQFSQFAAIFPTPAADEAETMPMLRASWTDPDSSATNPENYQFAESADQVRGTGPFPDLPLYVLSRDPVTAFPLLPADVAAQIEALWQVQQTELAGLSPISTHEVVVGAGHQIHLDNPSAVVDAIITLIGFARRE